MTHRHLLFVVIVSVKANTVSKHIINNQWCTTVIFTMRSNKLSHVRCWGQRFSHFLVWKMTEIIKPLVAATERLQKRASIIIFVNLTLFLSHLPRLSRLPSGFSNKIVIYYLSANCTNDPTQKIPVHSQHRNLSLPPWSSGLCALIEFSSWQLECSGPFLLCTVLVAVSRIWLTCCFLFTF